MTRQFLAVMALALAMPLAACANGAPPVTAGTTATTDAVGAKLARLEAAYADARLLVDVFLPFASPARQTQVRVIEATIEQAFAVARSAVSVAARLNALKDIEIALARLTAPG